MVGSVWRVVRSFLATAAPLVRGRGSDAEADHYCEPTPLRSPAAWIVGNCNRRRTQEDEDGANHHTNDSSTGFAHAGEHSMDAHVNQVFAIAGPVIVGRQ